MTDAEEQLIRDAADTAAKNQRDGNDDEEKVGPKRSDEGGAPGIKGIDWPDPPPAPASAQTEPIIEVVEPTPVAMMVTKDAAGAIVKAEPYRRTPLPFEHDNADHTWRLAEHLAKSDIVPTHLRGKPANVFVVLMTGREYGLAPMTSLNAMHVIEGKVGMSAQMIVGLCLQSPICEFFRCVDSTEERATYETRRRGWLASCDECGRTYPVEQVSSTCDCTEDVNLISLDTRSLTFTLDDAKQYGLYDRIGKNYQKKPAVMLRWRASSQLARDVYPDITLGLYNPDELDEIETTGSIEPSEGPQRGVGALKSAISGGE